nr:MAG TPA: hypothetical protein [Caudoviricetes sp.]
MPGALTSTNPILPPGSSTSRSGIPSNPGLTSFGAMPPLLFTALTKCCSTIFSRIVFLHQGLEWVECRS